MPYSAEISRANPSCFMFLIDQSHSMDEPFGGTSGKKKSEGLADAINRLLQNLVIKCSKSEGIRDYYHVGVIGYGKEVGPAFRSLSDEGCLVKISEIAASPLRIEQRSKKVEDGAGGLIDLTVKFPIWFEPVARGGTFMREALELSAEAVSRFISQFPDCYPPIVINITDGAAHSPPEQAASALRSLASRDGNVLLFNAHISDRMEQSIEFPDYEDDLPDNLSRMLFRMSSKLPPRMLDAALHEEYCVSEQTRGFVFNADLVSVIRFLEFGTRLPQNLLLGHTP